MLNGNRVTREVHYEIEQFLYHEARLLDKEMLREWFDTMLDPEIRYRMVMHQERHRKDKSPEYAREVMPFDERYGDIDMRVRQAESGLQTMQSPAQRMRRTISNVEAFHHDNEGDYLVYSNGVAYRHRRLYEHEQVVYGRTDVLKKVGEGEFRIVSRCIDLDERVVRNKNLLFFL